MKRGETTELLKQLIGIKSMSGEEGALGDFVAGWLADRGFHIQKDSCGNVYGTYQLGLGHGPRILLNTHLDNVPVGEGWETDPFSPVEQEGVLYGRGACDPKGAMAAMMTGAARLLKACEDGTEEGLSGTLIFMGAVREEVSPPEEKGSYKAVRNGWIKADMAICGEPTENVPCIGQFGKMEYCLTVKGRPAHAGWPEQGINAILHLSRLMLALDQRAERRWSELLGRGGTLNMAMVSGGLQMNIVPEHAQAKFERRLVPGQTAEESLRELRLICEEVKSENPGLEYELISSGEGNPAVIGEEEIVARLMADSVEKITGSRRGPRGFRAHCDADWLITYGGIPTVIFGPGSLSHAHTCQEQVGVAQTEEAADILLDFLLRAFGTWR